MSENNDLRFCFEENKKSNIVFFIKIFKMPQRGSNIFNFFSESNKTNKINIFMYLNEHSEEKDFFLICCLSQVLKKI